MSPSNGIAILISVLYVLFTLVCFSPNALSSVTLGSAPMSAIGATSSKLATQTKLGTVASSVNGHHDNNVARALGRVTVTNGANDYVKLSSNGAIHKRLEVIDKTDEDTYKEDTSSTDDDNSDTVKNVCKKNPVREAFDKFMSDLSGEHKEEIEFSNGCQNDNHHALPRILKDFLEFTGRLIKTDWHDVLLGPTKPYVSLMQRFYAWSKDYNELKQELEEEQKNNSELSAVDPAYILMQMASMEVLKINYARIDKMLADSKREKQIEVARNEQIQGNSLGLIDSNKQINKDYLDRLLLNGERMDYLLELATKVIETLEDDLLENRKLHEDYVKENGLKSGDHEGKGDDELLSKDNKHTQSSNDCLKNLNVEQKLMADKLSSLETVAEDDIIPGNEQPLACIVEPAEDQFNQAMNRLARIAKNELIEAVKGEVMILAQFYFINAIGFGGYKDSLLEAYICTIKGRLLGNGFFYLIENVPAFRQIADNTFDLAKGITCSTS